MIFGDLHDVSKPWNFGATSRHPADLLDIIFYEFDSVGEVTLKASKHLTMNDNEYMLMMSK